MNKNVEAGKFMTKRKKVIAFVISVLCAVLLGFGTFFSVREYFENAALFVNDCLPDGCGKEARVILLGGQSNASGCSMDRYLKEKVSADKYSEYHNGYDNVYINYFATDTNESCGFVKCATLQGEAGGFFGPELGLAEKLHETYPDDTFFIIKYAWGGSNLYDQWRSPSCRGKTGSLYRCFVSFVETSMKHLVSKNYDVKIEGMCWMQGESDSFSVETATGYENNLSNFISDLRNEFSKYAPSDGIAFVDAYIADNPMYWVYCDIVNYSKKLVADTSELNVVIDTVSCGLSCSQEPEDTPDLAHYDSLSEIKLGHLFADRMMRFFNRR